MYDAEIADAIRAREQQDEPAHDAHLDAVVDALLVGCHASTRPSPLRDALLRAVGGETTDRWRD